MRVEAPAVAHQGEPLGDARRRPAPRMFRGSSRAMAASTGGDPRPRRLARPLGVGGRDRAPDGRGHSHASPSICPARESRRPCSAISTTTPRWCAPSSTRPAARRSSSPTPTAASRSARGWPTARASRTWSTSTAFVLGPGQSLLGLRGGVEPEWWLSSEDGRTYAARRPEHVFYNDCPPEVAERAAAALVPPAQGRFTQELARGGLADACPRPTWSANATTRSRPPRRSAWPCLAETVSRIDASHSPFLSRPHEVTAIIQETLAVVVAEGAA